MPVFNELISLDQLFLRSTKNRIVINDLPAKLSEEKNLVKKLVTTCFNSDMLDSVPTCDCGHIKGFYNVGVLCSKCKTEVSSNIFSNLEPNVWFRKPAGVRTLITPVVLRMLRDRFNKKNGLDLIAYLLDPSYKARERSLVGLENLKRGLNFFTENLLEIYDYVSQLKQYKKPKSKEDVLRKLIVDNYDKVFCNYIPLPNRSLLVVNNTDLGIYIDNSTRLMRATVDTMVSIDMDYRGASNPRLVENRCGKILIKLIDYHEAYDVMTFAPKGDMKRGALRRHLYGTRTNFSFRNVITSVPGDHMYNDVEIPWGTAIVILRPMILSKLNRAGVKYIDAVNMINCSIFDYNVIIDSILTELLAESKGGKLSIIIQRNPSLGQGSAQNVPATINRDPNITVLRVPAWLLKAMNGDYDGDELNVSLAIDNFTRQSWIPLDPIYNVFDMDKVLKVSGNVFIPKVIIGTMSRYLS